MLHAYSDKLIIIRCFVAQNSIRIIKRDFFAVLGRQLGDLMKARSRMYLQNSAIHIDHSQYQC